MTAPRVADHPIDSIFLDRWSPRAFTGEAVREEDMMSILEAGRWAPSAFNIQPWRFLYSVRDDANWDEFVSTLNSFNAGWAKDAGGLIVLVSDSVVSGTNGKPDRPSGTHAFDAGAAWAQMALQATALGYHAHAMAGVDFDRARTVLNIPERFTIHIAVAIGRRGEPTQLSEDLQQREVPSQRLSLHETAFAGPFPS